MLGRAAYRTKRLQPWPCPRERKIAGAKGATALWGEDGEVTFVVRGAGGIAAFGVLLRLAEGEWGEASWRGLLIGDPDDFRAALAPSVLARCALTPGSLGDELPDGRSEFAIAGVRRGDVLDPAFLAPLTEEAWDEIVAAARTQVR